MSDKKKGFDKPLFSAGGLVLVLFILVLVNLIFSRVNLRWDSTQDKLYSLSEGTEKILSDLKQDVTIKVFYTKDNVNTPAPIKIYSQRVLDFLREYENYSKGKVTLEIYNTRSDSDEEDWAAKYGIQGIQLPTGEKIYLGLVAVAADQEETIPMMDPSREEHLEYDMTRIISRVQSAEKRKIGIISGLPVFGQPPMAFNIQQQTQGSEPWMFVTELKKTYDVEEIAATVENIDENIDLLMIVYPKNLSETLQYAVDQYVLKGGKTMVFADPFCVSDSSQDPSKAASLDKLFTAWGVKMETGKMLVDFDNPTRVRNQQNQIEDSPLWVSMGEDAFNTKDITTAKLEGMLFPVIGVIEQIPESKFEYESLLKSSSNSSLADTMQIRFGSDMLRRNFKSDNHKYDLAVRIQGTFKTAFPEGKPKDKPPEQDKAEKDKKEEPEKPAAHIAEGVKKSVIIIVADADFLFDGYYMSRQSFLGIDMSRMFNDNLNFVLNTAEMFTGTEELISIRSRGKFERPFTKVAELEKKAQAKWLSREQELVGKAEETNRKLREFDQKKDKSQRFVMSEEQEAEIQRFQEEKRRVSKELKEVRRNLRADIEALGTRIKIFNIFMMPLLVSIAGIAYGIYRRKRSVNGGVSS
ncbi:MAG: hypothetical protein BWK80_00510 [Desulfobacteraceae bacterium IS3]|nr:MAG: hypothetical protein BWK80_00510 [Desulfobacteraceae bacterium IS3]